MGIRHPRYFILLLLRLFGETQKAGACEVDKIDYTVVSRTLYPIDSMTVREFDLHAIFCYALYHRHEFTAVTVELGLSSFYFSDIKECALSIPEPLYPSILSMTS